MHITYNTRLVFQNKEDSVALLETLKSQQLAYNECSRIQFLLPKCSIVDLHNRFYHNFRSKYKHIPSQILVRAEQEVLSSYRSIRSNKHKITQAPIKKNLSMRLDKRCSAYKNGIFSIISLGKRVKCKPSLYPKLSGLLSKYNFCDPLIFVKNEEIWIAITFDIPTILPPNKLALGVDLGCKNIATTSEGKIFRDKNFNARKRNLRFLKRKLQSKNTKSAHRHLNKLRHKEHNINRNFTHNLANQILKTDADTIVLENLKSIKVKKHKYQSKNRISQVPFYLLRTILSYKALLHNKQVITVSPAYTSQTDHRTGKKDGLRRGSRYIGKDGQLMHADVNAACNIALKSKLPSLIRNDFAWQAKVISPIVCKFLSVTR